MSDVLDFEYSFCVDENYAKANRNLFIVNDRTAPWRDLPASQKQLDIIRSKGFRAGLNKLTRGQASDLISSGELMRAK